MKMPDPDLSPSALARLKPWHDVPRCEAPGCVGPMVTREYAEFNHRANPGDRIVCCACGTGRPGTDAEVEQAKKADAAWEEATRV